MGSFYGNGYGNGGNSSPGITNYNQLSNIPIQNLKGSVSLPINLADLSYGAYNIHDYFKDDKVYFTDAPLEVIVQKDTITNDKIITYQEISNGNIYLNVVTINEKKELQKEKVLLNNSGSGETQQSEIVLIQF